jgi:hypothetical protein
MLASKQKYKKNIIKCINNHNNNQFKILQIKNAFSFNKVGNRIF